MKFRLRESDGKIDATPYLNRYIPLPLLETFNSAIQEVLQKINKEAEWKKYYIHFEYKGKKYRQVDAGLKVCKGCVFLKPDGNGYMGCAHPHYYTKGSCVGRIYVEEE